MKKEKEQTITPSQYFDHLKGAKNTITTDALKNSYETFIHLAEKYKKLGQTESIKKLCFLADTLVKEEKLIEMGITTYVYKDVIEDYIEHVADNTVKIVELSRYMREIPDELVETVERTREIFDELYVVFTDYTGKEERKVEKERRDKDPILFGVFKNQRSVADRFYFLGDWVDEYCDLTLDKMVEQYKNAKGHTPVMTSEIPQNGEELVAILKTYRIDDKKESHITLGSTNNMDIATSYYVKSADGSEKKKAFFDKIKSVFSKK